MKQMPKSETLCDKLFRRKWIMVMAGFLSGILVLGLVRFVAYKDNSVHYHANFSLYINGQKDEFKDASFYEEVASCSGESDNPKARVHLHDQTSHLVHVHSAGVTWGQFFSNLGYTLGGNLIKTDKNIFINGQDGKQLVFILNGQQTESIDNKIIKSEDTLLINYGLDDEATQKQRFDAIPRDASKANTTPDPNTCSGAHEVTFVERLKAAVGFPQSEH